MFSNNNFKGGKPEIKDYLTLLEKNPLFSNFEVDELSLFLNSLNHKIISLNKDEILFFEGDTFPYMCILLEGEIMLSNNDEFGNRNIIDIIKKGQIFAEVFSFTTEKISPVTSQASKNSLVFLVNTEDFLSLDENDSSKIVNKYHLVSNLLNTFADKNLILLSKIEIISRRNTREKIIHFLEMQKEKNKSKIFYIPYSRKEMADFLGVDRSALSRELSKLKEEKVIDFDKNTFKIL